ASPSEGRLFRVDLRLRPEGDVGPLVWASCDAVKYYQTRGRTWERLALLKARPIAGHRYLGQTFLKKIRPFVMGQQERGTRDLVGTVHALRAQIHRRVEIKKEHERNVKFSPGGIRDIEFMVQTLQLLHAARHPQLFESNTMTGLQQLQALDLLQEADGKFLEDAYLFLRDVENKIQMVHELQTHTLPHQLTELTKCAVRMGYADTPSFSATSSFLARYESVRTRVLTIYERLLSSPS
ncbi:MAG: glutamate-ammonia-ligase adenylyltransferase, partial [Nitrospira sp. SB0667_bin_9]|nr:glutamate-ammonia-ligase adenylyltransferase [Nitrospira sp. SB0667_bin_9]